MSPVMNLLFATEDWQKVNMHEFPNKPWSASGLDKLIKKIDIVQTVLMILVVGLNHLEPENWPPNSLDPNPMNVDLSWHVQVICCHC